MERSEFEKWKEGIEQDNPGYIVSCILQYFRPKIGWQSKINYISIEDLPLYVAIAKAEEKGAIRVCVRLWNKITDETLKPDIDLKNGNLVQN